MPLNTAAKNYMLDQLAANKLLYASAHSADPGATGANEIAGGAPAYARKAITWNAAAGGDLDNLANPVFDIPPGTDVAYAGFWDAAVGGNFWGSIQLDPEHFTNQGTYTLTDADINAI